MLNGYKTSVGLSSLLIGENYWPPQFQMLLVFIFFPKRQLGFECRLSKYFAVFIELVDLSE